jgi:hypothetical protein
MCHSKGVRSKGVRKKEIYLETKQFKIRSKLRVRKKLKNRLN